MKYIIFICACFGFIAIARFEDENVQLVGKSNEDDSSLKKKNKKTSQNQIVTSTMETFTTYLDAMSENGTDLVNSTFSTFFDVTTPKSKKKKKKSSKKRSKSITTKLNETCDCDLWLNSCDVNCCCDMDCSSDDKMVFTKCIDDDRQIIDEWNLKFCNSKKLTYRNNTPWYIEQRSNSLFCVYKQNLPPKIVKNPYKIISTNEEMEDGTKIFPTWSWIKRTEDNLFDNTKHYKYSDDIWVISNNSLRKIYLPISQIKGYCDDETTVRFLVDYKMSCEKYDGSINLTDLLSNLSNTHIVSSPLTLLNESWIENVTNCHYNVCIPMNFYLCENDSCILWNLTDQNVLSFQDEKIISKLQLVLYVNGSLGYTNASLFIFNDNIQSDTETFTPVFEIKHLWTQKNSSLPTKPLSGNPGYKVGKPIIVSAIITQMDNSSQENDALSYFMKNDSSILNNILFYPTNVNNWCHLSNSSFNEITFNENIQSTCKILMDADKEYNATTLCRKIQDEIFSYIGNSAIMKQERLLISSVGNPLFDMKSWVELIYDYEPMNIKGSFIDNDTIQCTNVAIKYDFEFAFASIINSQLKKQNNVLGARLKINNEDIISFLISDEKVQTTLSLTTRFFDLTTNQIIEYAKGPNFHLNLPNDFFYPFSLNKQSSLYSFRSTIIIITLQLIHLCVV